MFRLQTKANLITPCNGKPLIAATQDFITASFLTSRRGVFFTRQQFSQVISHFSTGQLNIDLPKPCIIKARPHWLVGRPAQS
jgi:DNA-directed RNA polymerase III subunit RPC1